jgi:hypothetical protein
LALMLSIENKAKICFAVVVKINTFGFTIYI